MGKENGYKVEYLDRPGRSFSMGKIYRLVEELRSIAATCFDEIPDYQCLKGTREELSDKVITLARDESGKAVGFCSAALLPVSGVGDVLHLGLTCVRSDARGGRLTHQLTSRLLAEYLLRHPLSKIWVSNVACVLSSLGNVALNFDDIYPSPFGPEHPSENHLAIARAISAQYREKIYIKPTALFDTAHFVFRGSVEGTVFEKGEYDSRYRHRDDELNDFYGCLMEFENGDEVLQVGNCSLLTLVRYFFKGQRRAGASRRTEAVPSIIPA
ncbi:MAG: hypothetical protein AB1405_00885 [Bdellovibrionota bacterium]